MIIITGGRGPLGRAFQEMVAAEKIPNYLFPTSSECDLTKTTSLANYAISIGNPEIEGIIHLAAFSGGAQLSREKPASMITKNLLMTINVLEFARTYGIKRVILCLSTTCYSTDLIAPSEDQLHLLPQQGVDYAYAWAKRSMEPFMRAYNGEYGMSISCVLVNGIIGPHMNFRDGEMILPAALIKRFYGELQNNSQNFSILTDGSEIREYTLSADLARAVIWCYNNQDPNTLLNIGSTEQVTVKSAAFAIAKALGIPEMKLEFGGKELISRPIQSTNNSRFRALSNFKYTSFAESIVKTTSWYVSNVTSGDIK